MGDQKFSLQNQYLAGAKGLEDKARKVYEDDPEE